MFSLNTNAFAFIDSDDYLYSVTISNKQNTDCPSGYLEVFVKNGDAVEIVCEKIRNLPEFELVKRRSCFDEPKLNFDKPEFILNVR